MITNDKFDLYDQVEDLDSLPAIRNVPEDQYLRQRKPPKIAGSTPSSAMQELAEQENELNFSYTAAKHEKKWLTDSLTDFYRQQWFDDVLRLIKGGGKEASVYQCLGNQTTQTPFIAAKVYRPRKFRQLRNDSLYREGRLNLDDEGHEIHNDRALHAIRQGTAFGMRLAHTSWIEHEFQTLTLLHKAGADVPKPYMSGNNAILMEYIGWDEIPAPTLNTVNLPLKETRHIFDQAIHNVNIMLAHHRIHGDLSAFNILYMEGQITLIDFPQAIDPGQNRNAYHIFCRDILRLCEYFIARGVTCDPQKLAQDLWTGHGFQIRQPIDPRLMDLEKLDS